MGQSGPNPPRFMPASTTSRGFCLGSFAAAGFAQRPEEPLTYVYEYLYVCIFIHFYIYIHLDMYINMYIDMYV